MARTKSRVLGYERKSRQMKTTTGARVALKSPRSMAKSTTAAEMRRVPAAGTTGKSVPLAGKKRRWRAGTVALREIRKYQKTFHTLIPRKPFERLVRDIASNYCTEIRFQKSAIDALQSVAEDHLIRYFDDLNYSAIHANRVTAMPKDAGFVRRLRSKR